MSSSVDEGGGNAITGVWAVCVEKVAAATVALQAATRLTEEVLGHRWSRRRAISVEVREAFHSRFGVPEGGRKEGAIRLAALGASGSSALAR